MDQSIILVDENDCEIGYGEKLETHRQALLHRAFSIFLFDRESGRMLLQRRAKGKYHSGGLWSNACCSHPRRGKTMEQALMSRLKEELGLDVRFHIVDPGQSCLPDRDDIIYSCGTFQYHADFDNLSENELDHVFLYCPGRSGFSEDPLHPNPEEIEDLRWVTLEELTSWMAESPEDFSAWFKPAYDLAYHVLCRQTGSSDTAPCS